MRKKLVASVLCTTVLFLGMGNSLPLLAHQVPIVVKQAERKLAETLARKFPSISYIAFLSFIAGSLNGLAGNSVVEVTGSMSDIIHLKKGITLIFGT